MNKTPTNPKSESVELKREGSAQQDPAFEAWWPRQTARWIENKISIGCDLHVVAEEAWNAALAAHKLDRLIALVEAVQSNDCEIFCDDVNGKNWFDERAQLKEWAVAPSASKTPAPVSMEKEEAEGMLQGRSSERETHELKTWPIYFEAIWDGRKTFELRRNDRNYRTGDRLVLHEYDPEREMYLGRVIIAAVTYKMVGGVFGLDMDYCVMGLQIIGQTDEQAPTAETADKSKESSTSPKVAAMSLEAQKILRLSHPFPPEGGQRRPAEASPSTPKKAKGKLMGETPAHLRESKPSDIKPREFWLDLRSGDFCIHEEDGYLHVREVL